MSRSSRTSGLRVVFLDMCREKIEVWPSQISVARPGVLKSRFSGYMHGASLEAQTPGNHWRELAVLGDVGTRRIMKERM